MRLLIKVRDLNVSLVLLNQKDEIDCLQWRDKRDLLENLLPNIDKLLKRNKLSIKRLKGVGADVNMDETYSTYRIVKSSVDAINFCIKNK